MIKYNATRKSVYTEISVEMILYLFDEVETGHVIQIPPSHVYNNTECNRKSPCAHVISLVNRWEITLM